MTPLIIPGKAHGLIPAFPMAGFERQRRPLSVLQRELWFKTSAGWVRVPAGYVTDFASIPWLATVATGMDLQALGPWAWRAILHDWLYAIGEPRLRQLADDLFLEGMALDGVPKAKRLIMHRAVRLGGAGGYKRAADWWETANFADPETGAYPIKPPFAREEAFAGRTWGRRLLPGWPAAG